MKEIIKKSLVEILRVVLSALLAVLGLSSSGCIAHGNGSTSAVFSTHNLER